MQNVQQRNKNVSMISKSRSKGRNLGLGFGIKNIDKKPKSKKVQPKSNFFVYFCPSEE